MALQVRLFALFFSSYLPFSVSEEILSLLFTIYDNVGRITTRSVTLTVILIKILWKLGVLFKPLLCTVIPVNKINCMSRMSV